MTVRIKICGLTRRRDAEAAVELGADLLGFNFYPPSPRHVDPALVRSILADLPRAAGTVGVFVNEPAERIIAVLETSGLAMAQLHGDEPPQLLKRLCVPAIKAIRVSGPEDLAEIESYQAWAILVDSKTPAFGGSGLAPEWALAAQAAARTKRMILAGGLDPDNVAKAIRAVRPWGVDVASGVESEPGIKDKDKMKRFIEAVKNVSE